MVNGWEHWQFIEEGEKTQAWEEKALENIIDEEVRNNLLYDITVQLTNILNYDNAWLDELLTNEYRTNLYKCYDKITIIIANR